jgi:hypothetical protein
MDAVDQRMAVATEVTTYVTHNDEVLKWSASGSAVFGSVRSAQEEPKIKQGVLQSTFHMKTATHSNAMMASSVEREFEASRTDVTRV